MDYERIQHHTPFQGSFRFGYWDLLIQLLLIIGLDSQWFGSTSAAPFGAPSSMYFGSSPLREPQRQSPCMKAVGQQQQNIYRHPPLQHVHGQSNFPSQFQQGQAQFSSQFQQGQAHFPSQFQVGQAPFPSQFQQGQTQFPSQFQQRQAPFPSQFQHGQASFSSPFQQGQTQFPSQFQQRQAPFPSQFQQGHPPFSSPLQQGQAPFHTHLSQGQGSSLSVTQLPPQVPFSQQTQAGRQGSFFQGPQAPQQSPSPGRHQNPSIQRPQPNFFQPPQGPFIQQGPYNQPQHHSHNPLLQPPFQHSLQQASPYPPLFQAREQRTFLQPAPYHLTHQIPPQPSSFQAPTQRTFLQPAPYHLMHQTPPQFQPSIHQLPPQTPSFRGPMQASFFPPQRQSPMPFSTPLNHPIHQSPPQSQTQALRPLPYHPFQQPNQMTRQQNPVLMPPQTGKNPVYPPFQPPQSFSSFNSNIQSQSPISTRGGEGTGALYGNNNNNEFYPRQSSQAPQILPNIGSPPQNFGSSNENQNVQSNLMAVDNSQRYAPSASGIPPQPLGTTTSNPYFPTIQNSGQETGGRFDSTSSAIGLKPENIAAEGSDFRATSGGSMPTSAAQVFQEKELNGGGANIPTSIGPGGNTAGLSVAILSKESKARERQKQNEHPASNPTGYQEPIKSSRKNEEGQGQTQPVDDHHRQQPQPQQMPVSVASQSNNHVPNGNRKDGDAPPHPKENTVPTHQAHKLKVVHQPHHHKKEFPRHHGDKPYYTQAQLDTHHRHILNHNPTKEDANFENDEGAQEWFMKHAAQFNRHRAQEKDSKGHNKHESSKAENVKGSKE